MSYDTAALIGDISENILLIAGAGTLSALYFKIGRVPNVNGFLFGAAIGFASDIAARSAGNMQLRLGDSAFRAATIGGISAVAVPAVAGTLDRQLNVLPLVFY